MSFADLPPEEQATLFNDLQRLYDEFEEQTAPLPSPQGSCAGCGRCCTGPPLYMTCSDLEFHYARAAWEQGRTRSPVTFEDAAPDRRHAFAHWTCPFYSQIEGCTVYEARPFACRVFGRYARVPIEWDFCAWKDAAVPYTNASELPAYDKLSALLKRYPARRGYPWHAALPYTRPAVEMLLGTLLPWSPMENVRIPL